MRVLLAGLAHFHTVRSCIALLSFLPWSVMGQILEPDLLTELPAQLDETSGLLVLQNHVWTILDSGNPAALYEVDPSDGSVIRTVELLGASNVDYEDIASDDEWIYIGDFGNNAGARTNLRVYRIPRSALEDEGITQVAVDTIRFTYADQTDFTPAPNATNFDCEAMVALGDSLFLFTKRWLDERTRLYALPALPGDHVAQVRGTFDTDGLVTSASWDGIDRLALLGHENDPVQPFVWLFNSIDDHHFFAQGGIRREVDMVSHQTEGIAWYTPDEWIISNEMTPGFAPALWSVEVGQTVDAQEPLPTGPRLFPLPSDHEVRIEGLKGPAIVRVVDRTGHGIEGFRVVPDQPIELGILLPGMYTVLVAEATRTWYLPLVIAR